MTRFSDSIQGLVGKYVRLGRGGPETKGYVLGAKDDFLTLFAEDGTLVHYPLYHLKSVTEQMDKNLVQQGSAIQAPEGTPEGVMETLPESFWGLMKSFVGKKVKLYDHGPESAQGFLFECGDDFVCLVTGPDEIVRYPFFHIRSVCIPKNKQQNQNKNQSDDKAKAQDDQRGRQSESEATREVARAEARTDSGEARSVKWVTGNEGMVYYPAVDEEERDEEKERSGRSRGRARKRD